MLFSTKLTSQASVCIFLSFFDGPMKAKLSFKPQIMYFKFKGLYLNFSEILFALMQHYIIYEYESEASLFVI